MLRAKFGLGIPTTLMWEVKFVELTTFAAVVCSHTDCFGAFLQCHYVCFPSKRAASLKRIPTKKVVFQRMMSSKKTQPAIHREPGKPLELSFIYLEERKKKISSSPFIAFTRTLRHNFFHLHCQAFSHVRKFNYHKNRWLKTPQVTVLYYSPRT